MVLRACVEDDVPLVRNQSLKSAPEAIQLAQLVTRGRRWAKRLERLIVRVLNELQWID